MKKFYQKYKKALAGGVAAGLLAGGAAAEAGDPSDLKTYYYGVGSAVVTGGLVWGARNLAPEAPKSSS
jgi:hypothetical protein